MATKKIPPNNSLPSGFIGSMVQGSNAPLPPPTQSVATSKSTGYSPPLQKGTSTGTTSTIGSGGGGGSTSQIITQSTATNQPQVQAQIQAVQQRQGISLQQAKYGSQQNKPPQFTGTVEVRNQQGRLEQRQYLQQNKIIAEESQMTGKAPEERQGKVSNFVVEKNRKGQVVGVQETREQEQPAETINVNANQMMSSVMVENDTPKRDTSFLGKTTDFLFGESGKKYVGIGMTGFSLINYNKLLGTNKSFGEPIVSFEEIGTYASKNGGMPGKVFNVLLPKTPGEVVLTLGTAGIYGYLPKLVKIGVTSYAVYTGTSTALDTSLPPEQRLAGGIVGGLGAVGFTAETLPYIRGVTAKFSPSYKPVVTAEEGYKAINLNKDEVTKIGLIPEGYPSKTGVTADVNLPSTSPLVRGGFHVQEGYKNIFIGKNQWLATSQRDLFKVGTEIPLEKEFFVTPEEPFINIPVSRVSRLGLDEGLFNIPKNSEIGFGLPGESQIGIMKGNVGWKETSRTFKLGKGTELEAIKGYGTIQNIKNIGVTSIKGQGVKLYSFEIGKGTPNALTKTYTGTSVGSTRVSGEGMLSLTGLTTGLTKRTTTKNVFTETLPTTTSNLLTTSFPTSTTNLSTKNVFTTGTTTKKTSSGTGSMGIPTYSIPTRKFTPPSIPTYPKTPRVTPPYPKTPRVTPPYSPPRIPSYPIIPNYPRTPIKNPPSKPIKFFTGKQPKSLSGFNVFIRRQGKFKPIGFNLPKGKAFSLGEFATQRGLSQTFKLEKVFGGDVDLGTPKGYYKKQSKKGILFIEQPRTKINTASEKALLNFARGMKGGNRKKRR